MCRPPKRREHVLASSPVPIDQPESHRNLLKLLEQLRSDCVCNDAQLLSGLSIKDAPADVEEESDEKSLPYYQLETDVYSPYIHRPPSSLYSYECSAPDTWSIVSNLREDAIVVPEPEVSEAGSPWSVNYSPVPPPLRTPSSSAGSTYANSHDNSQPSAPNSCLYVATSADTLVDDGEPHFNSSFEKIEYAERFVDAAVCVMESIWPISTLHTHPAMTLPPLRLFVHEFLRRSRTSFPALQLALLYLARLRAHLSAVHFSFDPADADEDPILPGPSSPIYHPSLRCGRRMFLTALMAASKYLLDRPPSNLAWARLGGLELDHLNTVEASFLGAIQFDLFVSPHTWSMLRAGSSKLADHAMPEEFARVVFQAAGADVRGFAMSPKKTFNGACHIERWRSQVDMRSILV